MAPMFILKRSRHASKICLGRGELQNLIVSFDFSVRLSLSCSVVGFVGSVSVSASSCVLICVLVCVLVVCKFKFTCRDVNAASAGAVSRGFSMPFAWDMLRWIRLASLVASFRNSFLDCFMFVLFAYFLFFFRKGECVCVWYRYIQWDSGFVYVLYLYLPPNAKVCVLVARSAY